VGIEFETYFRFGEICIAPIYKGYGAHHDAGDAVATLTCLQVNKSLLHRVERAVWRRQTFHRGDSFGYVSYPDRARRDGSTTDENGARTALSFTASESRAH
jgi:hypothetical protein